MDVQYTVIFRQADKEWTAYVPDLPGCVGTGNSLDDAESNIREAIVGHVARLRKDGEPVPRPTSLARLVTAAIEHS